MRGSDFSSMARRQRWCWRSTAVDILHRPIRPPHQRSLRADRRGVRVPPDTAEFAINVSDRRHCRTGRCAFYIDDCLQGANGERGEDFNMRWIGSLVAETFRILIRGGVVPLSRRCASGLSRGPPAADLRSASDRLDHGVGWLAPRARARPRPRCIGTTAASAGCR